MPNVSSFLDTKFPGDGRAKKVREELLRVCNQFMESGLADAKFAIELTSGSNAKFWSCLSEALFFDRLSHLRFELKPSGIGGPDFLLNINNRRVWIEVICPEPRGLPNGWTDIQVNQVISGRVPHNEILLRWTSAIKEKTEKLIGSADGKTKGYVQKKLVSPKDMYVIAVNGCQLRHGPFSSLCGVSRFPYAIEAVFPIGPYQIAIDRNTKKVVDHSYQERYQILNLNNAPVPTYTFLDPKYEMVSAIWAVDFNGHGVIGSDQPSALIHNPLAINPLPPGCIPHDEEYVAIPSDKGGYDLQLTN